MNPICHFTDSFVVLAAMAISATAPVLAVTQNTELTLLMVPLVGAVLMSGVAILQATAIEAKRVIIGRSIFAVVIGVASPQVLALMTDKFNPATVHPIVLLLIGGMPALFVYFVSRSLVRQIEARSDALARMAMDAAGRKIGIEPNQPDENKPK